MIHENYEIIGESTFEQFRNNNIAVITAINSTVESIITDIKKDEITINEKITVLDNYIKELTAIYLSFHSMSGTKSILNLQSLINRYKTEAIENHHRIDAAAYLIKKMNHLISDKNHSGPEPFRNYPSASYAELKPESKKLIDRPSAYKWVTFSRNNSWFIAEFSKLEIINIAGAEILKSGKNRMIIKTVNNITYHAINLMKSPGRDNLPLLLIKPHESGLYYAADTKGKEIYASKDFVSPIIDKFHDIENSFISGRLRLFGINHLYLINNQCSVERANRNCAGA
jgi:hypothetical protein